MYNPLRRNRAGGDMKADSESTARDRQVTLWVTEGELREFDEARQLQSARLNMRVSRSQCIRMNLREFVKSERFRASGR